jgi:hypothetical protein
MEYEAIPSCVIRLLFCSCPPAIVFAIVAVLIRVAVNCEVWLITGPHIFSEILK